MKEVEVGKVSAYFAKIGVAAVEVSQAIKTGEKLHFKGHTSDFEQLVESLQVEHESLREVKKGDSAGIKVKDRVRPHDTVYRVEE